MSFFERIDDLLTAAQNAFGEDTQPVYNPHDGEVVDIQAIFDNYYFGANLSENQEIQAYKPVASIKEKDLIALIGRTTENGDKITIRGHEYDIMEAHPDGKGDLKLVLHY